MSSSDDEHDHPDDPEVFAPFLEHVDGESERPEPPDTSASWQVLRARMRRAPERRPVVRWVLPVAAAAGLTLAVLLSRRGVPAHVYSTARGERSTVRLADGTTAHLAPGTQLRVEAGGRHARLDGEAYFEVVHDPAHPFTVVAGSDTVRDVGTAYAVRAYAEDHALAVTVREGRVMLTGAGLLGAGDVARIADGVVHIQHGVDTQVALAWVDGHLSYHDAPIAQVLRDASRWYVIDVSVPDTALSSIPFTGSLTGLTAHDAVALVAATTGLRARWLGAHVTLEKAHAR